MRHTPTPWILAHADSPPVIPIAKMIADESLIIGCSQANARRDTAYRDARFLVAAANSNEPLYFGCDNAFGSLVGLEYGGLQGPSAPQYLGKAMTELEAALAQSRCFLRNIRKPQGRPHPWPQWRPHPHLPAPAPVPPPPKVVSLLDASKSALAALSDVATRWDIITGRQYGPFPATRAWHDLQKAVGDIERGEWWSN
jgi:hypothetical protein